MHVSEHIILSHNLIILVLHSLVTLRSSGRFAEQQTVTFLFTSHGNRWQSSPLGGRKHERTRSGTADASVDINVDTRYHESTVRKVTPELVHECRLARLRQLVNASKLE